MAVGRLEERGFAVIEAESTGRRVKMLRLTAKGRQAKAAYHQFTRAIEQRWQTGFGKNTIASLRGALEPLAGETSAQPSPLFRALELTPTDGGRRSPSLRPSRTIPWSCIAVDSRTAVEPSERPGMYQPTSLGATSRSELRRTLPGIPVPGTGRRKSERMNFFLLAVCRTGVGYLATRRSARRSEFS
jgi:hypothetical protein